MRFHGLLDRVWNRLRRLFRRTRRRFEINTRRPEVRRLIVNVCADGDFATKVDRPEMTIGELREA